MVDTKAVNSEDTMTKKVSEGTPVFDLSKKKKKKKPKPTPSDDPNSNSMADSVAALNISGIDSTADIPLLGDVSEVSMQSIDEVMDFPVPDFSKKKKKWRKPKVVFDDDGDDPSKSQKQLRSSVVQPWDGSDRDYTYSELINRAFQFLHGKNPALAASQSGRKKISLSLPQVAREGTKKTVFMNFGLICKQIHRQQDHLLSYMSAELGTTGNMQDGGRLVIKGKYSAEAIVKVIKRYMSEYVICTSCRSPDTVLMRDANTRLYFVSCESCGAKRSVAPIRQGYMAQVERRKKKP